MHNLLLVTCLFFSANLFATEYTISGKAENKLLNYTSNRNKNLGNYSFFQLEQKAKLNNQLLAVNQFKTSITSLEQDLANNTTPSKKNTFDTFLGENYLRWQSNDFVFQVGYQEVVWGESFGFNFADIINPKDNRQTFYENQNESRIAIPLVNIKYFLTKGSLQLIYGPRAYYSKNLPLELFMGNYFNQYQLRLLSENSNSFFNSNDYGAKLSSSLYGIDLSIFHFNYIDREAYFSVISLKNNLLTLKENHSKIASSGLSLAKTIYDFVIRSDLVYTTSKVFNSYSQSLNNYQSNQILGTFTIDSPTYEKYNASLIFATSKQLSFNIYSLLPENPRYFISRITRTLDNEKSIEMSYTRDITNKGNAIQTLLNWPINNNNEIKLGGEFYFGETTSNFEKIKKLNNIFISFKNYFQL